MRSNAKCLLFSVLIILIFAVGTVSADDLDNATVSTVHDDSVGMENVSDAVFEQSDEITVKDWNDLQLYCSKSDKDYVLKLKENTNYYPKDPSDESYQIQVNNNVTILGSSGAYIGDYSPDARPIEYLAIDVPENSGNGITLKGVTFKWISAKYQSNAVFLQMAGNSNNCIEDCIFTNSTLEGGHSSLVHLLRGHASITNSTFTDIISDFGCVSIYDPNDNPYAICTGARMDIADSYFKGNYARTEPGCINNCGVLVVRNTTFYKNTAFEWAGAIHTHTGANTTIYDSNFTDNLAGWNGGAICTYSYLQIYNTIFIGNNCTTNNGGGAIFGYSYLSTPHIYVQNSLFKYNENLCWSLSELSTEGVGRGGAISILGKGSITVLNNTFIQNSASIGTAICAVAQGKNTPTDTTIIGNRFINHTRIGDVLVINLNSCSLHEIRDNVYLNNSIEFSKFKLTADDQVGDNVTLHIDAALKNENYYDSDILEKSKYDVYVDGKYYMTVEGKNFTLDLKNLETCQVYVVSSISSSKSNEVSVGKPKEHIYVSQKSGSDANNGSSRQSAVATIAKACELARAAGNIIIMDGTYEESAINIDYSLKITGEDDVTFSGTSSNTIFTVSDDSDFTISNIIFDTLIFTAKNTGIIRQGSGFTVIENCEFRNNSRSAGFVLIEAKNLAAYNSTFSDNKNSMLIKSNEFSIDNCTFSNNAASDSTYYSLISTVGEKAGVKGTVLNSVFKSNTVKNGCIYFDATGSPLTIANVEFSANRVATAYDHSSCIKIANSPEVKIDSSVFTGNVDRGSKSAAIFVDGSTASVSVSNSVIVGNSYENSNDMVFSASRPENLNVYHDLNRNWWGNTWQNFTAAPPAYASACGSWLFLNASANATSISKGQNVLITYDLNNLVTREGAVSRYDAGKFDGIEFDIMACGGEASDDRISLVNGQAQTVFTLTSFKGNITAEYCDVKVTFSFESPKMKPNMVLSVNDTHVGEVAVVEVEFDDNVTGNLTVNGETKAIAGSIATFELADLAAGENVIEAIYSGDDYWLPTVGNTTVNVYKNNSTTRISYGEAAIGKDVSLTVDVTETATGSITLTINNETLTLTLANSTAQHVIKSIARGNYVITAVYNGDSKYLSSSDTVSFGIGRIDPEMSADVSDIVYGQDAVVNVVLNANATGNISVNVDGRNKTSRLENGRASIPISDLTVGFKTVHVEYLGDNYYNPANASASFEVLKADTAITVAASDIMVGAKENIEVTVPEGVTGNVTIICGESMITKAVNVIGKVLWTVSDLPVGEYVVSATLISDNYNAIENTTEFSVSDYLDPQWPNQGFNIGNDGKSPYESDSNGAVLWTYLANGTVSKNMAVDSEGNVCIVTSTGVYSIDSSGKERWRYSYVDENISGIAISRDVVIVPIAGNSLFFVNQTTGQRYGYSHVYQASSAFAPVVDSEANVYVSSEYQNTFEDYKFVIVPYSLWETGGNPVMISLGKSRPIAAPVIVADSYAVVACSDGVKIIDLAKNEISSSISGNTQAVRPAAGSGNIIYAVINSNIQAMTPQGNVIWKTPVTSFGGQLALDEENGLYFINSAGNLYRYDLVDGGEMLISDLNFTSGMLIGNDGNVYIGLNEMLYAFDCNGNVLWKSDMGENIIGTPVMDEDGIIYAATSNALKAIGNADLMDTNLDVNVNDITLGDNATVMIAVPEEATGIVNVEIDSKIYQAVVTSSNLAIAVPNLGIGHKTVKVTYSGDGRFKPKEAFVEFNVFGDTRIIAEDADSYCGGKYVIALKDMQGNAIAGETLSVAVGNNKYTLITNAEGEVTINLYISPGTYQVNSSFTGHGCLKPSAETAQLNVSTTIQASEMKRGYNSGTDFKATFLASDGTPLANKAVSFAVNGIIYNATTDSNGTAVLNAQLAVGSYDIVIINPATGENATQKATIVKRIISNNDLTMDYLDGSYFKVRIVGDDGNYAGAGQVVTFKTGGKSYTAKTDSSGYAKIKITFVPKTYSLTTEYKGFKVSNKIVVKQVLKAKNVSKKKAKSYKFQATLKTSKGKAISGKKLTFKIKNKKYTAKTNKKGVATITIKLKLKVGKYTITTTYSKTSIKNKLTVKK